MNLALEKGERVTTGGKGKGEIGGEAGEVANAFTMDGLGKRYGMFSGWGMAAGKVEVLHYSYIQEHLTPFTSVRISQPLYIDLCAQKLYNYTYTVF